MGGRQAGGGGMAGVPQPGDRNRDEDEGLLNRRPNLLSSWSQHAGVPQPGAFAEDGSEAPAADPSAPEDDGAAAADLSLRREGARFGHKFLHPVAQKTLRARAERVEIDGGAHDHTDSNTGAGRVASHML